MDIKTPENKFQDVSYREELYTELLDHLVTDVEKDRHHLSLFLGIFEPNKQKALKEIEQRLDRKVQIVDTSDLSSRIESESFEKLDDFFDNMEQSNDILYFKNGEKLCGVYTSYSHSHTKYATPQERYFLKKVKQFNGLVIVDIEEFSDADKTLRRAAHSVVSFTLPQSKLKRAWWHLRNFSFHGFQLKTTRPEAYGETG
jgi:inorganic triphosphatase YgiF